MITGNRGQVHLLQAAFYAVKLEVQLRNRYFAFDRAINSISGV
jgi:hypothetical protein